MSIQCPHCGGNYLTRYFERTHKEDLEDGKWVPDRTFGEYGIRYNCNGCSFTWSDDHKMAHMAKKKAERMAN
jgi:hypothetical protein